MITTNIILEKKITNKEGKHAVKLCLNQYFKGEQVFINLKLAAFAKNFENGTLKGSDKYLNSLIAAKKTQIDRLLQNLELSNELHKFSPKTLKKYLENGGVHIAEKSGEQLFFKTRLTEFAKKCNTQSTLSGYNLTLKKVADFCDMEKLLITDINVAWLKDFDDFCTTSGMTTNGKAVYLRNIRTIYNDAIDRELVGQETYPFRRFKIKHAETKHRNASIEDLRKILNFDCKKFIEQQKEMARAVAPAPIVY